MLENILAVLNSVYTVLFLRLLKFNICFSGNCQIGPTSQLPFKGALSFFPFFHVIILHLENKVVCMYHYR